MNCPDCGRESNRLSRICPFCGAAMNESGMRRTGQAQLERVYPKARPEPSVRRGQKSYKSDRYYARRFAINWAHVLVALLALSIVAGAAFFAYLHLTHPGQVILARKGKEATPQAYWTVATEYLNTGDIPRAVENFEYAKEIDYEASLDAGILSLQAEAYEAALRPQEAVEVYYEVVNKVRKQDRFGFCEMLNQIMFQVVGNGVGNALKPLNVLKMAVARMDLMGLNCCSKAGQMDACEGKQQKFSHDHGSIIYQRADNSRCSDLCAGPVACNATNSHR